MSFGLAERFLTLEVRQALRVILEALIAEPMSEAQKEEGWRRAMAYAKERELQRQRIERAERAVKTRQKNARVGKSQCPSKDEGRQCGRTRGHRGRHKSSGFSWSNPKTRSPKLKKKKGSTRK